MDFILPGIPPTGKRVELALVVVVQFDGDALAIEPIRQHRLLSGCTAGGSRRPRSRSTLFSVACVAVGIRHSDSCRRAAWALMQSAKNGGELSCLRYPDINAGGNIERRRHNSDHGKGFPIQAHSPADSSGVSAELLLPETLTKHHNLPSA